MFIENRIYSSRQIRSWLWGPHTPIVSILRPMEQAVKTLSQHRLVQGLGFVWEVNAGKLLVVTVRHHFTRSDAACTNYPASECFIHRANVPPTIQELECVGEAIFPPGPADIALLVLREPRQGVTHGFTIPEFDPVLMPGSQLVNVQNQYVQKAGDAPFITVHDHRSVRPVENILFGRYSEQEFEYVAPGNMQRQEELQRQGYARYGSAVMANAEGCAGSPIFNYSGMLYGINCRGQRAHAGAAPVAAYHAVSTIHTALEACRTEIEKRFNS